MTPCDGWMTCCDNNTVVEGGSRDDGFKCFFHGTSNRGTDHKHSLLVMRRCTLKDGKFPNKRIFHYLKKNKKKCWLNYICNVPPEKSSAFQQVHSSTPVETFCCFGIKENHCFPHLLTFQIKAKPKFTTKFRPHPL